MAQDLDEFPRLAELKGRLEKLSPGEFVRVHPRPALYLTVHSVSGPPPGGRSPSTPVDPNMVTKTAKERSFERTSVIPPGATSAARYNDRVAFLAKRAGNPFPNMISIGRALNNDVVVVLSTVSKLHGYFLAEGPGWCFIDHRSRNGTRVNDQPVAANERQALADGDRLEIGLELQAVFFTPAGLVERLKRS